MRPYKELRKEVKGKGEKQRYIHLKAEFQRIARRDKKAFLSGQCKEIEENNKMGKTRDLFKKIRDTKGTFHAKMGSTKDRNGMDLTEAEDIKKRWQEYTEELYSARFGSTYTKIGMIQRLAWPLHKDDTQIREAFHILKKKKKKKNYTKKIFMTQITTMV